MIKINYPELADDLKKFEADFFSIFPDDQVNEIDNHLVHIKFQGQPLNFERLSKMNFEELIESSPLIKLYSDKQTRTRTSRNGKVKITNRFTSLFDYEKMQPKLAYFFMNNGFLNLKTCHYCSIDFINSFKDISDYSSALDFLNHADFFELQYMDGIGVKTAQSIIDMRQIKKYASVDDIPINNRTVKNKLKMFDFKHSHNHFTLDHLIPQNSHRFYSLCLYNLVPACHCCNLKFKNRAVFDYDDDLKYISPTSKDFSVNDDFKFKIFFSKKIEELKLDQDFVLQSTMTRNSKQLLAFLSMFKIMGRYSYHKGQILELIQKKVKYPNSKIAEMSKQMGISVDQVRRILFGEELFDVTQNNLPFLKFRRDIGKNILLPGVV